MRQLTVFEHDWLKVGEEHEFLPGDAEKLADVESMLPPGCLQWGHRQFKFTQFCGVVQIEGLQIEVLPKLTPYQTEAQQRDTMLTMLACAGDLEGIDTLNAELATSRTTLLDLFIWHFARQLERQLQQGLLRNYQDIEDTLDQVRGRIDLVRQQRENLFNPQRLACRYSELVADIPINRLLHSALILTARLSTSPLLIQQLHALRMRFSHVGILKPHEYGPNVDQLDRMQQRYSSLVALAHLFLNGQFLDTRSGRQQAFSMLFDMNRLFERYTANRLRPLSRRHGLKLIEQGPRRYLGYEESGRGKLLMRPDISLLDENKQTVAILDAKWKRIDKPDALACISAADLYQLTAYATVYSCNSIGLLYPEQMYLPAGQQYTLTLAGPTAARLKLQAIPLNSHDLSVSDIIASHL